ncbi:cytochrome [Parafrankia colletiae]|uniref:Cytochrome n=1 Tax=Parafrankia colletiae TaxID=573497 RepID=A0A1S1QEM4_9ACTN|nr:cytochrome P450 [Parafrankia colletiae]MCK9902005.1 cytochrome P450 [Frankia sp. Cpl3]OHV33253.1 cytochrome [Parafrankia colletiae]
MTELTWNPYDKVLHLAPYDVWRELRDKAPVYRNDELNFYALSRYDDIEAAHRDPQTYSSAYGTVLEIMSPEPMQTGHMIFLDPPTHTELRTLVSRAFTPRRISALEDSIRALCAEMLDPQIGGDGFDFVQDFAAELPSKVISELIGVDPADREQMRRLIDLTFHIEEGAGMVNDVSFGAQIEMHTYLTEQLELRRSQPRDDMMTSLVQAEIVTDNGVRRLSNQEAADFANLLISAGTETVARLLGWACSVLAEHPDQRAELVADPSLIGNTVEELLRYEAPSPVQGRTLTTDVELHGTRMPAKSRVLLITGSGGRDERKYPDADRFDIHRQFDSHVSLGHGVHFCLGAALARLEARVALQETLRRFPEWGVDHERAVRLHTSTVRGYEKLPITLG